MKTDFQNEIINEGMVKIRIDAVGGDLDRVACKYPPSFMDEMARQLTAAIEAAMGIVGIADSSVELVMMFAAGTYMEHISDSVTYRRLMLLDKVSAPRDFWVKWTRLAPTEGEYNESNILFELGEDVDQKVREREYRYLLTAGKEKYHNSMGRKKVTEWREVIKRAIKRGEISKVETDFELAPETIELEERIADLLGKRIEARNQPVKEDVPFIKPEDDEFARAMAKARMLVEGESEEAEENAECRMQNAELEEGEEAEEAEEEIEVELVVIDEEAEEDAESEETAEECVDRPDEDEEIEVELVVIDEETEEDAESEESAEESIGRPDEDEEIEVELVVIDEETEENAECRMQNAELEEAAEAEESFDVFDAVEIAEEIAEALSAEYGVETEENTVSEEGVGVAQRPEGIEWQSGGLADPEGDRAAARRIACSDDTEENEATEDTEDTVSLEMEQLEIVESAPVEEPATTVYQHHTQQVSIADRVADIRAELETKIRLEYEETARKKAEAEVVRLRHELEALRTESDRIIDEAKEELADTRAELERLRLEYEHLLAETERADLARAADEARRRTEEAQLRAEIESQLRREAAERERLAEAARMAIEEQHRLQAENARIARQREEEERLEAERQRRLEEERLEAARRAELERLIREEEEAQARAKAAMPDLTSPKYAFTSKTVKLVFRKAVDPNITTRIQQIIKATVDYYGKDNVYLRIRASVPDSQTVVLEFAEIPLEEMELLGNIIKILGNSGLGIAKAIID